MKLSVPVHPTSLAYGILALSTIQQRERQSRSIRVRLDAKPRYRPRASWLGGGLAAKNHMRCGELEKPQRMRFLSARAVCVQDDITGFFRLGEAV